MKRISFLFLIGTLALASCGGHTHDEPGELPTFVSPTMTQDSLRIVCSDAYVAGTFNGAVVIVKDGQVEFEEYYGVTDASGLDTLDRHSAFRLASLSKAYTCAGILRLEELGQISIDSTIEQYIPEWPYTGVTAKHLMNHTSGIADLYMDVADDNSDQYGPVLTVQEVLEMACVGEWPQVPAGDVFEYSNSGYVLLAALIERVSGSSFEQFMHDEVFAPLGMAHTRVWNLVSPDSTFQGKTTGFEWIQGQRVGIEPTWQDGVAGDGAVFTSGSDLVHWERFWRESDAVSSARLNRAFENEMQADGELINYGFGWDLGENVQFHTGGWLGAATYILRIPEEKTMAVVYSNAGGDAMEKLIVSVDRALGVEE